MAEQRKQRSAQQKLETVLAGMRGDRSVRDVCREHDVSEALYYNRREGEKLGPPRSLQRFLKPFKQRPFGPLLRDSLGRLRGQVGATAKIRVMP